MNERIEEFREQSIKWAYENQQSMNGAFDKFAELLIKECIKASMVSILDNNIGDREDCLIVGSDIADHFGME